MITTLCRLRLLAFLLLLQSICLVACAASHPASPSPSPSPTLTFTPQPTSTLTPSLIPTRLPATQTPPPPAPSATNPQVVPSSTPVPAPTDTVVPTPSGIRSLHYDPRDLVLALAWSPQGDILAVAAGEKIRLVDADTLVELRLLPAGAWAGSLAFNPDGTRLALAAKDGSVQLWDPAAGQLQCRLEAHHPGAKSVAFSPDGRWLASTGNDAYVRLWDISAIPAEGTCDLSPYAEMIGGVFSVPSASFSPDGKGIASVDSNMILLREVSSQRLVRTIHAENSIFSLAYSPDGSQLASAELGNTIHLWDVASGEMLRAMSRPGLPNVYVASVAFSPDGKLLAAGSSDGAVVVWDPASGQLVHTFAGHARAVTGVAFKPDGRWLASGSLDATVRLWPDPNP
jgi:dipeptidyl aminopeptidase/acylaminoacyl peptidase